MHLESCKPVGRRAAVAVFLGLLLAPASSALAASGPKSVAVIDVKAVGAFDPSTIAGLSSLIASEAARFEARVVAGADIAALMSFDRQRQLLGCSDDSCLSEIGGALGVDYLLISEVSEVGGVWLITMVLLDVRATRAVNRLTQRAGDQRRLVEAAGLAVERILVPVFGQLRDDSGAQPAPQPVTVGEAADAPTSTRRVVGLVSGGAGLAALAAGAAFGWAARDSYEHAKSLAADGRQEDVGEFEGARAAASSRMTAANVLYVVGGLAVATGAYLTFTGGGPSSTSVTAAPASGGGILLVSGGF